MTAAGDLIGGRYLVERIDRAVGTLRRALATDRRLDRPVLLWMSESSGVEEDALLAVAHTAGQAALPSFLRVLDVAYDDDGVAVVLERTGDPLVASMPLVPIDARAVRALLDDVDRAEEDEALTLVRVTGTDLSSSDGEVSADPIALFLPLAAGERAVPPGLLRARLGALFIEHAENALAVSRALDEVALDDDDRDVSRAAAAVETSASLGIPYVDDEPTLTFVSRPTATAVAERPPVTPATPRVEARAVTPPAEAAVPSVAAPTRPPRRALPWRVFVPLYATLAVIVLGAVLFAVRLPSSNTPASSTPATAASGPPAKVPAAGRVTVGLFAKEDSGVRVTVDDVVQFDGILKAGESQAWEGKSGIDVWTDKGKTLGLAVNGKDLGPYSPAMGHADWNRIDYPFWPGWGQ